MAKSGGCALQFVISLYNVTTNRHHAVRNARIKLKWTSLGNMYNSILGARQKIFHTAFLRAAK